jgi:hypothetical protein
VPDSSGRRMIMLSADWRVYAAALDDATRSLEALSRHLQHQAGEDQLIAQPWGVLGTAVCTRRIAGFSVIWSNRHIRQV